MTTKEANSSIISNTSMIDGAYYYAAKHSGVNENELMILLSSTILGALMFLAAPALMGLMGADGEFLDLAVTYLRVYALFSPVTTITFAMDNYLKISGKINTSMGLNIFMSVGAAIIEIIFIFVFRWGVWSAALATCLSMFISAIIAIVPFAMGKRSLKFVKPHLGKDVILRILGLVFNVTGFFVSCLVCGTLFGTSTTAMMLSY